MTSPEYLTRDDRHVMLQNIEALQLRLSLIAHRLISQPENPLPDHVWDQLDMTFMIVAPATRKWVN